MKKETLEIILLLGLDPDTILGDYAEAYHHYSKMFQQAEIDIKKKTIEEEKIKYYISMSSIGEKEVTKEEFMEMEMFCGFYPKIIGETATENFGMIKDGIKIKGRKEKVYEKDD